MSDRMKKKKQHKMHSFESQAPTTESTTAAKLNFDVQLEKFPSFQFFCFSCEVRIQH